MAVSGNRTLADHAFVRVIGDWEQSDSGKSLEQHFRFANDLAAYGLTYTIAIPDGTPPGKCTSRVWAFKTKDVTLGMSAPVGANWYTQAFSSVRIDGLSLHDIPATFRIVRADGDDALAEGLWDTPKGPFLMRLLLRAGDDKLLVQYVLPSENSGTRLDVRLVAYPHGFQKPWDRHMATATRDVGQQSGVALDPAMERWALFYDEGMWKTKAGGGPCGFVYVPDEVEPPRVTVGPYSVAVHLRTKPEVRRITVGLWDFTTTPDVAAVRSYLRNGGEKISDDVATLAKTEWLADVARPAQLPTQRREELTQLVAERRKPTPYDTMTAEIATPHVAWAKPLPDGPVRTLVVCPRWYQRETVELAQRLDLDCQTVSLAGPDELFNATWLYLYGSYDAYGYKRKTEIDVLDELNRAIRADRDCIMLSGFKPQILPASLRRALMEKTRGGGGLVLLGDCRALLKEFDDSLQPVSWNASTVPLDRLPGLNQMVAEGRPLWRAYQFGRGRVLTFDYNTGNSSTRLAFTPGLTHEDPDVLGYYDYYHSLLAAGVMWAARRELDVQIRFHPKPGQITIESAGSFAGATLEAIAHDPTRRCRERTSQRVDLRQGKNEVTLPMTGPLGGPRLVSVCARYDGQALGWGTGWWDVPCDSAQLRKVKLQETSIKVGETVAGSVELTQNSQGEIIELEVWDTDGRLLESQQLRAKAQGGRAADQRGATAPERETAPAGRWNLGKKTDSCGLAVQEIPFRFTLRPTRSILLELHVRLCDGDRLVDHRAVELTVPDRSVEDFHFLVWSSGQNHPIRHFINRELAKRGVDWIDNTGLTGGDRLRADVYCRNAARYGLRSIPYITRISSGQESGRERRPCLHDSGYRQSWTSGLQERAVGSRPFGPPAYTLGDENFLVNRHLDVCIAPPTLEAFRLWLTEQYETIDRLNQSWKTDWTGWQEVVPATFEEVKDESKFWPRWADHRTFMDRTFTEIHALGREAIRRADPGARVGFDGVFTLDSWHGYDFYQLSKACDLVQVYATQPQQIEYLRSWHSQDSIRGAWYNHIGNTNETSAKWLGWHLLLHDMNSSWYWTSFNTGPALLFPDLRPTPQFLWMQESLAEIKAGIGRLLLAAERQHDGIAVHYSQASVHAGTLTRRRLEQVQWGFMRLVEDLGLQYQVLSYEQIEQGQLDDYRVLLLPASAALSPREAAAIRQFTEQGGLVIADTLPGWLDHHCRVLDKGLLDDLFGVRRAGVPKRGGNAAIQVSMNGLDGDLQLQTYDAGLQAETAAAWAAGGDVPAVLVRDVGKGRTVVLNADICQYESLRSTGNANPVRQLMSNLLEKADVRPQARVVDKQGHPMPACEVVRFADAGLNYVAVVSDHRLADVRTQDVSIHLPAEAVVYDIRTRELLGKTKVVQRTLEPGDPLVLALTPYVVERPIIEQETHKCTPGEVSQFVVRLSLGGQAPAGSHCLRVEATSPDGSCRRCDTQNVLTSQNKTTVSIPLPLNAPAGAWKLRVTDVATGKAAQRDCHAAPS